MAPDRRPPGTDLGAGPRAALLRRPQGVDLFQAISLLERSEPAAARLGFGSGRGEAVRLSAHIALGFAPSDVHAVRRESSASAGDGAGEDAAGGAAPTAPATAAAAQRWHLSTPVLALAGGNGPLPLVTTEALLECRGRRDLAPLAFLDIFHHRWLSFLYRARKQHRLSLQWEAPTNGPVARALDALSGLGLGRRQALPAGEAAWLRHAALQGPAPRSMAQLVGLAADRLGLPVHGRQFIGGWLPLAAFDTPGLGRGTTLGQRALLGRRAWDSSAGIRLCVGPVPAERMDPLLPGGPDLALLRALARQHLQQDMAVHVELHPASTAASLRGAPLGRARLGWSSWLSHRQGVACAPVRLHASTGSAAAAAAASEARRTAGPVPPPDPAAHTLTRDHAHGH